MVLYFSFNARWFYPGREKCWTSVDKSKRALHGTLHINKLNVKFTNQLLIISTHLMLKEMFESQLTKISDACLFTDKYLNQFGGGSQYAYYHEEDESSFHLVDTSRPQKPIYMRNRNRFNQVSFIS